MDLLDPHPFHADNVTGLLTLVEEALSLGITTVDLSDVYGWYADGNGTSNDLFAKVLAMQARRTASTPSRH